ncbi:hypothetical protein [Pectinatus cerevisiiphilus]|uniref:Uncharacterized protein n=1 Tax=Pectinatus cerevisiiphilus TaxID=86956 RepID=A0A4R3K2U4_9FIRM|nr:hypothetical protein [Pectinatus cerevisiiphilus]TCS76766.1 hypothetical protein EDC37_12011 [Pectinatus cerevisiiphilus]
MIFFKRIFLALILVLLVQCGVYYYIDQVMLTTTANFHISEDNSPQSITPAEGEQVFYSYDKKFAAKVGNDQVSIYNMEDKSKEPQNIDLGSYKPSFFEWMPDRNLAILALYGKNPKTKEYEVYIRQYNPLMPDNKTETELKDVPNDSKVVDVAYSTATNVVYMKLQVAEDKFRIYRTDANYDTRRISVQAEKIGRIAVFADKDIFLYDNLKSGEVYMFDGGNGSWRVISPPGRFRLVGVENENIFIAKYDKKDNNAVLATYQGKLGIGFEKTLAYEKPEDFSNITLDKIQKL